MNSFKQWANNFNENSDEELESSANRERKLISSSVQSTKEEIAHLIDHYVGAFNYWKNNKDAEHWKDKGVALEHVTNIMNSILVRLRQFGVPIKFDI